MGSNRLIEKGEFMYDTSYKIPMIIKQPGTSLFLTVLQRGSFMILRTILVKWKI